MSEQTIKQKVELVNHLLLDGEPGNISVDKFSGYVGYKPQFIVDAMNEVFGIGEWGFRELSSELDEDEQNTLAIAQVETWLAGVEFHPAAWDQSKVTRGDRGDAKKGAH